MNPSSQCLKLPNNCKISTPELWEWLQKMHPCSTLLLLFCQFPRTTVPLTWQVPELTADWWLSQVDTWQQLQFKEVFGYLKYDIIVSHHDFLIRRIAKKQRVLEWWNFQSLWPGNLEQLLLGKHYVFTSFLLHVSHEPTASDSFY